MEDTARLNENIVTDRYATILQVAERLFREKGSRVGPIDEISQHTGVSKGLVLYHFSSKKALLERMLRDGMSVVLTEIDANIKRGESVKQKIRAAVEAHLSMLNSRPYLLRIAFFEGVFGEEIKDIFSTYSDEILLKIQGLVQEGITRGEFKQVDSQVASVLLLGMIIGLRLQATMQQPLLASVDQAADEITELFCQGLRP